MNAIKFEMFWLIEKLSNCIVLVEIEYPSSVMLLWFLRYLIYEIYWVYTNIL